MANKRVNMLRIRKIIQMLQDEHSGRRISSDLKMGRHTVDDYVRQIKSTTKDPSDLLKLGDAELLTLLIPKKEEEPKPISDRQKDFESQLPYFSNELKRRGVTKCLLWQEYKQKHPDGYSHSQFCELLLRYTESKKASFINVHIPGDVMQADFAGDKLFFLDKENGAKVMCDVLVCSMPFSSQTYVEAMTNARQENFYRGLSNTLEYFKKVPHNVYSDNMKQFVFRSSRYEPTFSYMAEEWSVHYNTALHATRVRKPKDKASVESHVNIVYMKIYARMRNEEYYSLAALNNRIWELLDELNDNKRSNRDYSRRVIFEMEEMPVMKPLPEEPFVIKHRIQATVQQSYHILLGEDMHYYSVPYQYIKKKVTVVYDYINVEVYYDYQRIAIHQRNTKKYAYSTLKEHMPKSHATYVEQKGWDAEYFIKRAEKIGEETKTAIQKILSSRPFVQQTYNSCIGIFRLGTIYGEERLRAACLRLINSPVVNYTMIKNILDKNLDKENDMFSARNYRLPEHENTRGAEHYQ